jgi:hypothetical protein
MAPLSNASACVSPFPMSQNTIDALERLRESYEGLLAQAALTELDQAVLMAVELTLKHVRKEELLA